MYAEGGSRFNGSAPTFVGAQGRAVQRLRRRFRLSASGRSLLTAPRSLEFAWDPSTNPEQARLKRAAIVAGGVVAGGLGLALLGKRRGWFNAPAARPRLQLPNLHPSAPAAPSVAPVAPSVAPAPAAPRTRANAKAKMAAIVSGIKKATPEVHAPVVANPAAKAKLASLVKGLNKGVAPAPSVEDKGSVGRILAAHRASAAAGAPPVAKARFQPKVKVAPDLARKPNKVADLDTWLAKNPGTVTAKKAAAATVKRTTKAKAASAHKGGVEEKIAHTENAMRHRPEHVRHSISRLHEIARTNPTASGRKAAGETLDKLLANHGLKKSSLHVKNAEMRSALEKFDKNLAARLGLVEFTRGNFAASVLRGSLRPRVSVPARGTPLAIQLASWLREARILRRPETQALIARVHGLGKAGRDSRLATAGAVGTALRRSGFSDRRKPIEFARGDPTRKFLWKISEKTGVKFPRYWNGKVPAVPTRGTEESAILAKDVRVAWRNKNNVYGDLHSNWARQALLRGITTNQVKGASRTWVEPGQGLEARLCATEFMSAEKVSRIGMAAVEMLPGGTAINAAGLAGVRTGVHLRRILRTRYGGLTNAALQIQPADAVGIVGEAAGTGLRDSRAFLRKTVRTLPRPVARVLNRSLH